MHCVVKCGRLDMLKIMFGEPPRLDASALELRDSQGLTVLHAAVTAFKASLSEALRHTHLPLGTSLSDGDADRSVDGESDGTTSGQDKQTSEQGSSGSESPTTQEASAMQPRGLASRAPHAAVHTPLSLPCGVCLFKERALVAIIPFESNSPRFQIMELLLSKGPDVNAADPVLGCSVLMEAVASRSSRLVKTLLGLGANAAHRDSSGVSVLHVAASVAVPSIMAILLEHLGRRAGALINAVPSDPREADDSPDLMSRSTNDRRGWTPLHALVSSPCAYYTTKSSPGDLPDSASSVHSEQVSIGDEWAGSENASLDGSDEADQESEAHNVNKMEKILRQLQGASQRRHCYPGVDTLMIMIKAGAKVGTKTMNGKTAEDLAARINGKPVKDLLHSTGSKDAMQHIHHILKHASNSLAISAKGGNLHLVTQLLQLGMDVNSMGSSGRNALHEVRGPMSKTRIGALVGSP